VATQELLILICDFVLMVIIESFWCQVCAIW